MPRPAPQWLRTCMRDYNDLARCPRCRVYTSVPCLSCARINLLCWVVSLSAMTFIALVVVLS